ncbi:hypothetical protein DXG01_007348 [Tephrocybe rancida]|nr:hypothetical protein DXG01_007348 [Tephrocybe rancida]
MGTRDTQAWESTHSGTVYTAWEPAHSTQVDFSFESVLLQSIQDKDNLFSSSPLSSAASSRAQYPTLLTPYIPPPFPPIPSPAQSPVALTTQQIVPSASTSAIPQPWAPCPSKNCKNKMRLQEVQKWRRDTAPEPSGNHVCPQTRKKLIHLVEPLATTTQPEGFKVVLTGFTRLNSNSPWCVVHFQEIQGPGADLKLIRRHSGNPTPILDHSGHIIGVAAGQDSEATWLGGLAKLMDRLEKARREACLPRQNGTEPMNLNPPGNPNFHLVEELISDPAMKRLMDQLSNIFSMWAPKL